jgi:hypothetical protein
MLKNSTRTAIAAMQGMDYIASWKFKHILITALPQTITPSLRAVGVAIQDGEFF